MTIQKTDFTPSEQVLIQEWIDTEIPARIASYQESVISLTATQGTYQGIEDIFEKIYTSWTSLHLSGFLQEIRGLGLTSGGNYFNPPILEAEIQTTAVNPVSTRLFPIGSFSMDPLYAYDLRALSADFDLAEVPYTGTPPGSTPTGYNERAALVLELTEWNKSGPPSPPGLADEDVIRESMIAEELALQTQLSALTYLNSGLSPGQGGQANLASAIATVNAALIIVQGHIALFPVLPSEATRVTEINTRLTQISNRVNQITSPGTDQDFVRGERYYWLKQRLNLGFGSLTRLASTNRALSSINTRIADLQAELLKYADMGF